MNPQNVIDESLPMLDDILGRIGLHRFGEPLNFESMRKPFSVWVQQQVISQEDFSFLVGLVGAFICEYLIVNCKATRHVEGAEIFLRLPIESSIACEFKPYETASSIVRDHKSLDDFLSTLSD